MRQAISIPASFFGMVLGLVGLGGDWRIAHRIWSVPSLIGESIIALAVGIWGLLLLLYTAKWLWRRSEAEAEFEHPVQCCFVGLLPVSTMLVGLALLRYSYNVALVIGTVGAVSQLGFAIFRTGQLCTGGRDPLTTTPILYLPTVAGNFITANLVAAFGYGDLASLCFGAGLLAWLALESVLMHRLYVLAPLAPALRPYLGIQFAPPVVGCSAYLSLTEGPPDLVAKGLLGYGLLQVLIVARMLPWIMVQPFAVSYWAFTFGLTVMAFDTMKFVERGAGGLMFTLAGVSFVIANLAVGLIAIGTVWLVIRGRIVPSAPLQAYDGAR